MEDTTTSTELEPCLMCSEPNPGLLCGACEAATGPTEEPQPPQLWPGLSQEEMDKRHELLNEAEGPCCPGCWAARSEGWEYCDKCRPLVTPGRNIHATLMVQGWRPVTLWDGKLFDPDLAPEHVDVTFPEQSWLEYQRGGWKVRVALISGKLHPVSADELRK